jgi:hypothetical protein
MLAREKDALMIPVIGTCLGVVKVGVIPSMVVGDDTTTWFVTVASLVGETAISAFVPIQQAVRLAPMTGSPFSSFLFWGVFVGPGRVRESQAWAL